MECLASMKCSWCGQSVGALFVKNQCAWIGENRASLHKPSAHKVVLELNPVSVTWSDWEYYYSSMDGMLIHHKVILSIMLLVSIYTPGWSERTWNKVSCLRQQHHGRNRAWTIWTFRPLHHGASTNKWVGNLHPIWGVDLPYMAMREAGGWGWDNLLARNWKVVAVEACFLHNIKSWNFHEFLKKSGCP